MSVYLHAVPKPVRKKRDFKRPAIKESVPLECLEQETVSQWLDLHKVFYNISISGAFLHPATFNRLKRMGYKRGLPDILIFDPPSAYSEMGAVGVVIEMKRRKGGIISDEQAIWLEKLTNRKWICFVAKGADEAINFLELCGYGGRPNGKSQFDQGGAN